MPGESPPRARGRDTLQSALRQVNGITPACAGKSTSDDRGCHKEGNHPRVRGEEFVQRLQDSSRQESPPRARGRVPIDIRTSRGYGITPACAGKSMIITTDFLMDLESPPRARGRADTLSCVVLPSGITPACAGKSADDMARLKAARNHPRVRGEERSRYLRASSQWESPPRARGRVPALFVRGVLFGITPACAGKSTSAGRAPACLANHPRVRGEEARHHCKRHTGLESPPRARGRALDGFHRLNPRRITPACAGKSTLFLRPDVLSWNHPRVRGEERQCWPEG